MTQPRGPTLHEPQQELFLDKKKYKIVHAPYYEIPRCAVPQTGQEPDNEQIENLPPGTLSVAAQRDVDVIAEPCAHADVPASPEFRDAFGFVRVFEVFCEMKTEEFAEPDRHIGVAAEIKIDLEGKADRTEPGRQHGHVRSAYAVADFLPKCADGVGEDYLFSETDHKPVQSAVAHEKGVLSCCYLVLNGFVTYYRAGDQLREQAYIGCKMQDVFLRFDLAAINIDSV